MVILSLVSWLIIAQNDLFSVIWSPNSATTDLNANTDDASWSQFRNSVSNTGYVSDNSPTPNKILWTFKSLRPLVASPAVVGDRVYLSTVDGRTVALNRFTGEIIWEYVTGSPSSSTAAVSDSLGSESFWSEFCQSALLHELGMATWTSCVSSSTG